MKYEMKFSETTQTKGQTIMTTSHSRVIPLTDNRGQPLLPEDDRFEPEPGSIVLTSGLHGTAWQRMFSSGLWHSCGNETPVTWASLINRRNVVLVYDADERPATKAAQRATRKVSS